MTDPTAKTGDESVRAAGLRRMSEVYGFDMSDGPGDFFAHPADHLFANVWSRDGLADREVRADQLRELRLQCAQQ